MAICKGLSDGGMLILPSSLSTYLDVPLSYIRQPRGEPHHVNGVDVRPFLTVDLDADKAFVQEVRYDLAVTPSIRAREHRLVTSRSFRVP